MRILAALPYYAPDGGGLERYAHETLRRLASRGHEVNAVAFAKPGPRAPRPSIRPSRGARPKRRRDVEPAAQAAPEPGREPGQAPAPEPGLTVQDGIAVHRVKPLATFGNTPVHPGFGSAVRAQLQALRPDVVLVHTPVPFAAEVASRVATRSGVPVVATYHAGRLQGSSPLLDAVARLDRATLEHWMLRDARHLVAVGPYVRDHALADHAHKVTIIPPGVDLATFAPGQASRADPSPSARSGVAGAVAGPTVLFVAPLDHAYRWKGVDVLWDAFQRVRVAVPEARLVLVGGGDRLAEFRHRAQGDSNIAVLGRVDDATLVALQQQADVTVLPSTTDAESFGMVLAQANACGRPVVGSDVGGIPDFVRPLDNGLLARPGDPAQLAQQIQAILTDKTLAHAMGQRGLKRVRKEHDWDDLAVRTERVLADAAGL